MLHKLWIEKGESCKLVLIQIHHKDFVGGRQIRLFRGELPIKIAHVFAVSLEWASKKETSNKVAKKEKGFKPAEKWVWHTVRNLYFLYKNSTLISRENCRFFFGWKTRENVVVLDFLAVDNFDSLEKLSKKIEWKTRRKLWVLSKFNFWIKIWLFELCVMRASEASSR